MHFHQRKKSSRLAVEMSSIEMFTNIVCLHEDRIIEGHKTLAIYSFLNYFVTNYDFPIFHVEKKLMIVDIQSFCYLAAAYDNVSQNC